jgi:hypothetical protein
MTEDQIVKIIRANYFYDVNQSYLIAREMIAQYDFSTEEDVIQLTDDIGFYLKADGTFAKPGEFFVGV